MKKLKLDQEKFDESVNMLKDNESLNIEKIYHILTGINLDDEIDGELFFKKEGFLNLFKVLLVDYKYLEY